MAKIPCPIQPKNEDIIMTPRTGVSISNLAVAKRSGGLGIIKFTLDTAFTVPSDNYPLADLDDASECEGSWIFIMVVGNNTTTGFVYLDGKTIKARYGDGSTKKIPAGQTYVLNYPLKNV